MDNKNSTNVLIDGQVYTLSGIESEDYIQRVALYINNKLKGLKETENGQALNTRLLNVLLALNIADDLYKEKDKLEEKDSELKRMTDEMRRLNDEIASFDKVKKNYEDRIEILEKELRQYKKELNEYIDIFDNEDR